MDVEMERKACVKLARKILNNRDKFEKKSCDLIDLAEYFIILDNKLKTGADFPHCWLVNK
jgi:hypothetical protein